MTRSVRSKAIAVVFNLRRVTACLLAVLLILTMVVGAGTGLLAVLPISADLLYPPQVIAAAPGQERSLARPSWRGSSSLDRGPPAAVFPVEEITTQWRRHAAKTEVRDDTRVPDH
jgi:hypothetical protein